MSLANGRRYLATPGPSVMPDRVLNAMHRAAPNIYEGEMLQLTESLWPDLKALAGTRQHATIYIGNGHAAWEAANSNALRRGDTAIVLATGRFGHGWAENAQQLGVEIALTDFGTAAPIDLERCEAALRAQPNARAVLVTHVDTATTVRNDIKMLRGLMDDLNHPALLMVDCIASLGCDEFRMDDWGVDVMVAASQKGVMTPPGLGFVFFSDKARAVAKTSDQRSPYWNWDNRADAEHFYMHFYGTAPTHHLFGLREALTMITEEGLEAVFHRHRILAQAVWAAGAAWSQEGAFALNIQDPAARSHAVTAMRLAAPDGTRLRRWCEDHGGLTLGVGLGMAPPGSPQADAFFRLAHMGHVNAHMTLGALAVMDAGMKALGIAHGSGALEAATSAIAQG
ncbi:pyridoxal-phosphate-dependent aminotransferase family protein [Pararhodobacter oceanensis]|uniref:pyridoxal-phosphate-dependent aminotransferase family protein n=1 Tax=Pararhodobacter oceanensis TaxID=2172121 RepID=UPI003A946836